MLVQGGIGVLGKAGAAPEDPPNLPGLIPVPRVGDPITSALLPGKIPSGRMGMMLDISTSPHCFLRIPVPDLKLQVFFQPRKSRLFPQSQHPQLCLGLNFCPADRDGFNCAPIKQLQLFPPGKFRRKMENRPLMP